MALEEDMFCYIGEEVFVKCAKSDSSIHTLLTGASRSQTNLLSRTAPLEDSVLAQMLVHRCRFDWWRWRWGFGWWWQVIKMIRKVCDHPDRISGSSAGQEQQGG